MVTGRLGDGVRYEFPPVKQVIIALLIGLPIHMSIFIPLIFGWQR